MKKAPANIILTRPDGIGDVVFILPIAKKLKDKFPDIKVAILGSAYTKALADACEYIDDFIYVEDFLTKDIMVCGKKPEALLHVKTTKQLAMRAKELKIPLRIGTSSRLYHWYTCNRLVRLSRKKSNLHEAQLNLKLLKAFGINKVFSLKEISDWYGLTKVEKLLPENEYIIQKSKYNVIIHPKSKGNAREWSIDHFLTLIKSLDADYYNIILSGMENERKALEPIFKEAGNKITDITGKLSLSQFISVIQKSDCVIANSTGPVHLGAALNINVLALFPPLKPKHPGRWAPVGHKVEVFVLPEFCQDCRLTPNDCHCINAIQPQEVKASLDKLMNAKRQNQNS
ncbi:MAG: glycosyltransferase family 9 protein [Parafilimonas sp.]